jgi:SNARE protein|mmetsp:Transcript_30520/g.39979  ORF Transcript_30520/g.39979 Transcript_30520/m.39979 type:complete len:251 (-) Transcript_30520:89-841(-)
MADVQFWEDTLRDELEDINRSLTKVKKAKDEKKQSYLQRVDKKIRNAQGTKRSFKMETRLVSDPSVRKQFENKLAQLDEELKAAVADARALKQEAERQELMDRDEAAAAGGVDNGVTDEQAGDYLLDEAKKTQDKTQESLNRTKQLVAESKEIGVSTLEELERQRDQIERIDQDADRIVDNLARSQALIKHFGKRMASDKFVQCFAVINVLLLVGVVMYAILKGGGFSDKDGGAPPSPVRMLRGFMMNDN